jgi:hypothetical protein
MTAAGSSGAWWRVSSYSGGNGDCVQAACPVPGVVAVRDSKDPGGPVLAFTVGGWAAFTGAVKRGAAASRASR